MSSLPLSPIRTISGRLAVPGDKSISHRYALFGAMATGRTRIVGLSTGADVGASLQCARALGARAERLADGTTVIDGWGTDGPTSPPEPLDCMNSGTSMRLLMGVLAGYPVSATLIGDVSLTRRPMRRVMEPLSKMGAQFTHDQGHAPIGIQGGQLSALTWRSPTASAQVKSAILLAGLRASGTTVVEEVAATRDHTELALPAFGVRCSVDGRIIAVEGGQRLSAPAETLTVPGDPSSAAVWAAASAALPGARVELAGVSLNPRRLGFIAALERMGAEISVRAEGVQGGEPVGSLVVSYGGRRDTTIGADEVPGLIDELPVLAASAALGCRLEVRGAEELRVKESDRISALVAGFRTLGVEAEEFPDGFAIDGRARRPTGGTADAVHDHRLVMAFALVALGATGTSTIDSAESVAVSYPTFLEDLRALRQ